MLPIIAPRQLTGPKYADVEMLTAAIARDGRTGRPTTSIASHHAHRPPPSAPAPSHLILIHKPRLSSPARAQGIALPAAIEDVRPQRGRELCARARVNTSGSREPSRSSGGDFPRVMVASPPTSGSGFVSTACRACLRRSSEIRKSARRSEHQASGRDVSRPGGGTVLHAAVGHRVPAFQRRSLWPDQASARRALAVAPRGSSGASTTAAMLSRCSPEPSVRSRQLPGAAA